MQTHAFRIGVVLGALSMIVGAAAGCGDDTRSSRPVASNPGGTTSSSTAPSAAPAAFIDPGDGGDYHPRIEPANFVARIDHPYMPLTPGSRWHYEGTSAGKQQTTDIVVKRTRKTILGVSTVVVRDTVREEGQLLEDTIDWFAQDTDGNVWYFGEDSKEYEHGKVTSTAGSWVAGVDGAQPGIVMPAEPRVGDAFRQEYLVGEAEDMMRIVAVDRTATVPTGAYDHVLVTQEWTPLEPKVVEEKYYAPGVGRILEQTTRGSREKSALVEYTTGKGP